MDRARHRSKRTQPSAFLLPHPLVSFQKLLVIPTGEPAQRAKWDWMAMLMKAFGTDWSVPRWCGLHGPKRINGIFSWWIPVYLFGRWYQSYAQTWARGSNENTRNYPISTLKIIRLVCVCVFLMLGIEHGASPYQAIALPLSYSYSICVLLPLSSHRHHQYLH